MILTKKRVLDKMELGLIHYRTTYQGPKSFGQHVSDMQDKHFGLFRRLNHKILVGGIDKIVHTDKGVTVHNNPDIAQKIDYFFNLLQDDSSDTIFLLPGKGIDFTLKELVRICQNDWDLGPQPGAYLTTMDIMAFSSYNTLKYVLAKTSKDPERVAWFFPLASAFCTARAEFADTCFYTDLRDSFFSSGATYDRQKDGPIAGFFQNPSNYKDKEAVEHYLELKKKHSSLGFEDLENIALSVTYANFYRSNPEPFPNVPHLELKRLQLDEDGLKLLQFQNLGKDNRIPRERAEFYFEYAKNMGNTAAIHDLMQVMDWAYENNKHYLKLFGD